MKGSESKGDLLVYLLSLWNKGAWLFCSELACSESVPQCEVLRVARACSEANGHAGGHGYGNNNNNSNNNNDDDDDDDKQDEPVRRTMAVSGAKSCRCRRTKANTTTAHSVCPGQVL